MASRPGPEHIRQAAAAHPALAAELQAAAQETERLAAELAATWDFAYPYRKDAREIVQPLRARLDASHTEYLRLDGELRREAIAIWQRELDAPAR